MSLSTSPNVRTSSPDTREGYKLMCLMCGHVSRGGISWVRDDSPAHSKRMLRACFDCLVHFLNLSEPAFRMLKDFRYTEVAALEAATTDGWAPTPMRS